MSSPRRSWATTSLPLSRVSEFVRIAEACELLGVSADAVCRRLGLPFWHDHDPDSYAPLAHCRRFLEEAARQAGSPTFGFSIAAVSPIDRLGAFGRGIARAATVRQALETAVRLMPAHSNFIEYWLAETDQTVWFCRSTGRLQEKGDDIGHQCALRGMIQLVQLGAGESWWPKTIVLQGAEPVSTTTLEELGEATVRRHPHLSAIAVPRELRPLSLRRPGTVPHDRPFLDEPGFLETAPAEPLNVALKQLVVTLMPNGYPAIESVAEIVGLHPRTLQRRLRHQSSSYRELVDEVRAERATVLLEVDGSSVTDIAFDLGYTDVSHFIRAFRRWTGVAPNRYRQLQQAA